VPRGKDKRPRVRTVRHFGVADRLALGYHAEMKRLLLDTDTKLRDVRLWLAVRDCDVTIGAICRYRQHLRAQRRNEEEIADEAEAAALRSAAFAHVARDGVTPDFLTASVLLCELIMLKSLIRLQSWPPVFEDPAILRRYCDAMDAVIDLREDFDRRSAARPALPLSEPPSEAGLSARHAAPLAPLPRLGRRGQPMIIESLPPDVRRRYERDVLRDPKTTAPAALRWLVGQGFPVSLSAVRRHRVRLEQFRAQSARDQTFAGATRDLAAAHGLSEIELAAGERLHAAHDLLDCLRETFRSLNASRDPAPAERIIALARALSAMLS